LLPSPGLRHLTLQPFGRFAKPPILFFQLLHAAPQLRVPSASFHEFIAMTRNCHSWLLMIGLEIPEQFFQP
jgi:hypothetical protein